jgi:hypothetical protein
MVTKFVVLSMSLCISAAILLFIVKYADTTRFTVNSALAQMNGSNVTSSSNDVSKNTMELAMSELAKIHLMAANEALMKGNTTAAFTQMNLAYLQFAMLGMKDMGTLDANQAMKFMQSGVNGSSSSNSEMKVPDNCIIIQGGVLQCRDILTGSYSVAK